MRRALERGVLAGYDPEIGQWLWALEDIRRRLLRTVHALEQPTIDWRGADARSNSIGSLLYHIGAIEMDWLYTDVLEQDVPTAIRADFPHEARDASGQLTHVPSVSLAGHLDRLRRSRDRFLAAFQGMTREDWSRPRNPAGMDYHVTPAWVVYHLLEHEAGHAYQISSIVTQRAASDAVVASAD